jgi:hypothetical protein
VSTINQLSEASAFSPSQQFPVYDTSNGQPRKLSGQAILDYIADNPSTPTAPVPLPSYTVAELPAAVGNDGALVYCTNGNTGAPCLAISNGTNWLRIALGAAVAAS